MRARRHRPAAARPALEPALPPRASRRAGGDERPYWRADEHTYVLPAGAVEYRVVIPDDMDLSPLLRVDARVGDGPWCVLIAEAGPTWGRVDADPLPPLETAERVKCTDLRHALRGETVALEYFERAGARELRRRLEISALGAALAARHTTDGGGTTDGYAGYDLGRPGAPPARPIRFPGLPDSAWLLREGPFVGAYFDRARCRAHACLPGETRYRPNAARAVPPQDDLFYLAVSDDPLDCLPALREPPAATLAQLRDRLCLDYYSEAPYLADARLFEELAGYGLRDLVLVYRNWEQFGYRERTPALYPADPTRGKSGDFRRLVALARRQGWLVALREEYAAISPDSAYFDPKCVAADASGAPRPARHPHQYAVAAGRMIEFARLESPKIERNYQPGAVHVGEVAGWDPELGLHQGDAGALEGGDASEAALTASVESLCGFLRELHGGPVLTDAGSGAARADLLNAGLCEGAEGLVESAAEAPLWVDYELREANARQVRFGAGVYRRAMGLEGGPTISPEEVDWDAYRATTLALGHHGYLGNYTLPRPPRETQWPCGSLTRTLGEYYLVGAITRAGADARPDTIHYSCEGEWRTLAEVLRGDDPPATARLRVRYENGLEVCVNRDGERGWTTTVGEREFKMPPWGWVARRPDVGLLAYSAEVDGQRADYCRCAEYQFLDSRSEDRREIEGLATDGSLVVLPSAIEGERDLVLVGGQEAQAGGLTLSASARVGLRLQHRSATELELRLFRTGSDHSVQIRLAGVGEAWTEGRVTMREAADGARSPLVMTIEAGAFTLPRVRPGATLLLTTQA